jgi:hypothetical protein
MPEKDEETIGGITTAAPVPEQNAAQPELNAADALGKAYRTVKAPAEQVADDYAPDMIEISDDIAKVLQEAADKATDFKSFEKELQKLITTWPADKTAELMATAFFSARAAGDSKYTE